MRSIPPILAVVAALVLGSCGPGLNDSRPRSPSAPAASAGSAVTTVNAATQSVTAAPTASPAASLGPVGDLGGLWLLVGRPGDMRLVPPDPVPATDRGLILPALPPGATWASGDRHRGFVASVGTTGRIVTLGPADVAVVGPPWRPLRVRLRGDGDLRGSLAFATLSPDGRWVAAELGDPSSGAADARLLVADRATGVATIVALDGRPDGRPPTWLGAGAVAIPILDRADVPRIAVIDVAAGHVTRRRGLGGPLAGSGDGRLVAAGGRTDGRIVAGPVAALGADVRWVEVIGPRPDAQVGQLLLDETGTRLAVASIGVAGDAAAVTLYRRDPGSGWTRAGTRSLPSGATRVVLVGFDP
jgi:hypothetical protein